MPKSSGNSAECVAQGTGKTPVNGGFQVFKFNGNLSAPGWIGTDGGAVRVSVSAVGVPWIVSNTGAVFERSGSGTGAGQFIQVSGNITDIAVGPVQPTIFPETRAPTAFVWSIARNSAGKANLSAYARQPGGTDCKGSKVAYAEGWLSGTAVSNAGGSKMAVAVGPDGQPWVVDNNGAVLASVK